MNTKKHKFLLNQIQSELRTLIRNSDQRQQDTIADEIAEVFADLGIDLGIAYDEAMGEEDDPQSRRAKEILADYMDNRADDLRSERIADQLEDETKETFYREVLK